MDIWRKEFHEQRKQSTQAVRQELSCVKGQQRGN